MGKQSLVMEYCDEFPCRWEPRTTMKTGVDLGFSKGGGGGGGGGGG